MILANEHVYNDVFGLDVEERLLAHAGAEFDALSINRRDVRLERGVWNAVHISEPVDAHAILLRLGRLQLPLRNGFSQALQAVTLGPVLPRPLCFLALGCSAEAAAGAAAGSLAAGAAAGSLGAAFRPAFDDVFEGRPGLIFGLKNCVIGAKPCSVAATWDFGRRLNGGSWPVLCDRSLY